MLRNCNRSALTSAAVNPVASNLSNPRGAADVLGTGVPGGSGECALLEVYRSGDDGVGGGAAAAAASASSSPDVRLSPMEQFT